MIRFFINFTISNLTIQYYDSFIFYLPVKILYLY